MSDLERYLRHLFGGTTSYLRVCTLDRSKPGGEWKESYLAYPATLPTIAGKITNASRDTLDAYVCAHGYVDKTKLAQKPNAAPIACLWVERDAATIPPDVPPPTLTIETSPGRFHDYWRLSGAVAPDVAEQLNRRLTQRIGGDAGWALTKRLRPPGSVNYKYPDQPVSRIVAIDEERVLAPDDFAHLPRVVETPTFAPRVIGPGVADPDADEPPVALSPAALDVWRGNRPVTKDGGVIDRSESLYRIGCELWEHGATRRTVAAELASRDKSLGWNRYADRPQEYDRIAGKVATLPRKVGPMAATPAATATPEPPPRLVDDPPPPAEACPERCAWLERQSLRLMARIDQLTAERDELRLTVSGAIHTYLNPHLPQSEKTAFFAALALIEDKRARGEVRADGSIELTSAEISDDYRQSPDAGESVAPTNKHGGKPRMSRDKVRPAIKSLVAHGFARATPRKVTRARANGSKYVETVWDFEPPANMADALAIAARWTPAEPKTRKPRSRDLACPQCGEVHPILRRDYCQGCGELRSETIIRPSPDAALPIATEDLRETDFDPYAASAGPQPARRPHVRKISGHGGTPLHVAQRDVRKISGHGAVPEEPPGLWDAPLPDSIAEAWMHAAPMPGFSPTPIDGRTDVMQGGRQ